LLESGARADDDDMPRAASKLRILADRVGLPRRRVAQRALQSTSAGQWLAVAMLAGTAVAAFGLAPGSSLDPPPSRTVEVALPLPPLRDTRLEAPWWREERVQRGDTIGSLLARAGVADPAALAWMRTDQAARPLYQLRPGRPVHVAVDDSGRLAALRFQTGPSDVLSVTREGAGIAARIEPARVEVREAMVAGEIRSSLFAATDLVGLPDAVTLALAEIFASDIDFLRDLRKGDRFAVVYETRTVEGEPFGAGRVLAAEFVSRGETFRAFAWRHEDGSDAYYTEDGRARRAAFLKTPMEFSRMTSGYSLARLHPIDHAWRAHRGVDYAAPVGTPVRATANGVVRFAGRQGGYGNVVVVQHAGEHSTLYAHLSAIAPGARTGARVRQGETIGLVGATGWATGPHLHYEFRVAGEPRDPRKVALPAEVPLAAEQRPAFDAGVAPLLRGLALARERDVTRLAAFE
jgi:murein DD-endopeptidase MepM/ murein hydrolase activator NlpD